MNHLVHRLANTLAFERRCIRSSFVALLATRGTLLIFSANKPGVSPPILSRAPCWRGASTLSGRQAIYDTVHKLGMPEGLSQWMEFSAMRWSGFPGARELS